MQQIPMPAQVRKRLETSMIGEKIDALTVRRVLGSGETAITYEAVDEYGAPWALKLVTRESYGERAPFREVARFAQALDQRFLVFPQAIGDWSTKRGNRTVDFVWFKSRCVRGETLERFVTAGKLFSIRNEVRLYMENIAAALEELRRMGFSHGDLHSRNIMREEVGGGGPLPEARYVVIDFSEAHPIDDTREGLLHDLESYGSHLRTFADAVYRRDEMSRDDEKVLRAIQHIPSLLAGDSAESMGIGNATEVLKRFSDALHSAEESPRKLRTPFDSLSAENITNDALLTSLCFTHTKWAAELEKPGNVLLVGPRGCGKSMMFRRLRLKTKIAAGRHSELENDPYVGFYLPCESIFFNRIADLSDQTIERYRDALILFFNMAVMAEVASTLAELPPLFGGVSRGGLEGLRTLLGDEIGRLWQELNLPEVPSGTRDLAEYAESVMRHVRKQIAYGNPVKVRGSMDFVTNLVARVRTVIPALSARTFIFFLDDYTDERVPLALQQSLHPIVCQRSGQLCFKISAHMFGSMYSFPQPLALDEGRNILVINLGSEYLNRDRRKAEGKALIRIMNDRFRECEGYEGSIEAWLGRSNFPGGRNLNRALHDPATRKSVKYHGVECLVELCTGDFSEMIRMVGEIFREARVEPGNTARQIDPGIQDRAIRYVSREFLSRIRHIRPDGQKLYDVVSSFGELSQKLLYERALVGQGKDKRGRPRKDPYDLLTVYVDDLTKASRGARLVWERLQRASVFVDIRLATSQRTVIADRATLRRIYCPAFVTGLTSSEHLQATKDQFEWFMDRPEEFCRTQLRNLTGNARQETLWKADKEEEREEATVEVSEEMPREANRYECVAVAPLGYADVVRSMPEMRPVEEALQAESEYDIFIGAMGFEERTTEGVAALVERGVRAKRAYVLEFDMYHEATAQRRDRYEDLVARMTGGKPYRPLNAPVGNPDPAFTERIKQALALSLQDGRRVLFDCTSCPSLILSKLLRLLMEMSCDVTIVYAEATTYYPIQAEWESGKLKPRGAKVQGPFAGVRFVERPANLQSDDTGERPVLLVLFPTFNTERTAGVLVDLEPAKRVWLIGEPHDLVRNGYRVEMAKSFAAPNMYPDDHWSLLTTFDYRQTMLALAGIYSQDRFHYRIVVMPHGSKMQTLGVSLFAATHQISMVFAMPKTYRPDRYSEGCSEVWAVPLGKTDALMERLRLRRVLGNGSRL
jgi:hypothetical protein